MYEHQPQALEVYRLFDHYKHSLCKVPQSPSLQVLIGNSYVYTKPVVRSCRLHEIDNALKTNVSAYLKKKEKKKKKKKGSITNSLLCFKVICHQAPSYLSDLLHLYTPSWQLRSSTERF